MKRALLACSLVSLSACGGTGDDAPQPLARPVTTLVLAASSPAHDHLIPGVVTAYRETAIPFEVPGRVESLINVGDEVEGANVALDGEIVAPGTLLATLDSGQFQRALVQAESRLASAKKQLDAQKVELATVLPARMKSAEARAKAAELSASYARDDVKALESAVKLAETTLQRNQELLPTGAVSDIAVRRSQTELQAQQSRLAQAQTLVTTRVREHEAALAAIDELRGALRLQQANNEAQDARIKELEQAVLDAKSNLQHCELRAPFPGRVTRLHVGEGSFVQAGSPIVTLTMMNPIEAVVTVSAAVEEQLVVGTDATIYPMDGTEVDLDHGVRATLYQKRGVADTTTRTFEIGLIAPNKRRVTRTEGANLPRVPYVMPVFENPLAMPGLDGLFTVDEAVHLEDGNPWVLRVRDLAQGARTADTLRGTLKAERIPVKLGERAIQVASFRLLELADANGLKAGDLLVPNPTAAHEQGFVVDDTRWLLRPGDLVQVAVNRGPAARGFYVPVQAIRERNGDTHVFLVGEDSKVREVVVTVRDSAGERRRIESSELQPGVVLVAQGAHFLQDGDRVTTASADGAGR